MNSNTPQSKLSSNVLAFVCEQVAATQIHSADLMQGLWGGQGRLLRISSDSSSHPTCVLKQINLDATAEHPRGWSGRSSYERKSHSYQVERHWYESYAHSCLDSCRVPQSLGVLGDDSETLILLEDLSPKFPLRCSVLNLNEVRVCLRWLAEFHGKFLNDDGCGLWSEGCYWHLATRADEFNAMAEGPVKDAAITLDEKLRSAKFQTLVHGDAKVANFCFNTDITKVAGVDFQYVGRGCGMRDVAYFLGSCLSEQECEVHEDELLDYYFQCLKEALAHTLSQQSWQALEKEWRYLFPIAWTDFYRFLLGWMPTHTKINRYTLSLCDRSLADL